MNKFLARISVSGYVALFFLVLSLIFYFLIPYQIEKPKLTFGRELMDMKPTLFPAIAALGLCAMCVLSLVQSYLDPEENPFKGFDGRTFRKLGGLIVILYLFALAFEPLGFLISGVIWVAAISLYLGNRNPLTLTLLSFGVPVAIYFIFTRLLLISLPEGLLD